MFNDLQRQRLKDCAKSPSLLYAYIAELQTQYPELFHHGKESLSKRVFFDKPMHPGTPYVRCLRGYQDSPIAHIRRPS